MAIDTDKLKDDAAGILNLLGKITPGGMAKSLAEKLQGNQAEVMKAIRIILSGTAPGRAAEAVKFIVDRYKIPESIAERMVANEMTDLNEGFGPQGPDGTPDDGYRRNIGIDSGAEDYYDVPDKKINISDLREKIQQRVPPEDRDSSFMQDVMPMLEAEYPYDKDMMIPDMGNPGILLDEETGLRQPVFIPPNPQPRPARNMATGGRVGLADGTMMASVDDPFYRSGDEDEHSFRMFGKPYKELNADELEEFREEMMRLINKFASAPDAMDERNQVMENIAIKEFGRPLSDLSEDEIIQIEMMIDEMVKRKDQPRQMAQAGGRIGFQTGGVTETRDLPPEFIEAAQRTYLTDLATQSGLPSVTTANMKQPGETDAQFAQRQAQATQFGITKAGMAELAPQVAAQDALQTQAYNLGQTGLGSFQPFLTDATTAAGAATDLTGTGTPLPQGVTAGSIEAYMSPYQQQVIDTTMADFDKQAQIRANQNAAATLGVPGAFGGGREGVQRAEYQAASDQNRAQTLANLRQSGFQNAAARRQQDLANQMGIANLQGGLGARAQDFSRAQISGLGTLGAAQQAQNQAVLDAQRQAAQMAIDEPRQALSRFGQGIAGITPGAGTIRIGEAPAAAGASPLMKALGLGLAGADIYGRIF